MCMKINENEWKNFKLEDLFNVNRGHTLTVENKDEYKGSIPCINGSAENNGVLCFLSEGLLKEGFKIQEVPSLSLSRVGNSGQTFLQTKPYYIADNAFSLILKTKQPEEVYLFLSTILNAERFKYSYGRTISIKKYLKTEIKLPSVDNSPNWDFMQKYIKSLKSKPLKSNNLNCEQNLVIKTWKEYSVKDLFDVKGTKTTKIEELEIFGDGEYPYVTTQAVNNGVENNYNYYTENGNVLTIDSAVLGFCAYQEKCFSASDHVEKLIPKFNMNKFIALFFVTLFNNECYKYSYGRKANQNQIKHTKLKLPTKDNEPDWEYMESYIKSLPYADKI